MKTWMKISLGIVIIIVALCVGNLIGIVSTANEINNLETKHALAIEVIKAERNYVVDRGTEDARRYAAEKELREFYQKALESASGFLNDYVIKVNEALIAGRETLNHLEEMHDISEVSAR